MRVYFDSEFTGLTKDTTLISIGLVSEDGKKFYAEFTDYDYYGVDEWIQTNVINNLWHFNRDDDVFYMEDNKFNITIQLAAWLGQWPCVEMWGDCLAYDWVLFCDLFSGARTLPRHIDYIPIDLSTIFSMMNINADINREQFARSTEVDSKHNALHDAEMIKACVHRLELEWL